MAFLRCAPYLKKVNLIGSLSAHIFQGHSSAAFLRAKPSLFAASLATISLPGLLRRKSSIYNSHFSSRSWGFLLRLTDSSLQRCAADMSEAEATAEDSPAAQCARSGASDEASEAQGRRAPEVGRGVQAGC